ncbi:hypothetical protein [Actinoplanes sp. NPDC051859]|uniref:hypothetical protein n=1 Tax=Actinoplanes sp. NPDC051859 TaxID=3363909 RepID=UPI0037B47F8A
MRTIRFDGLDVEVIDAETPTERSIEFSYVNDAGKQVRFAVAIPDDSGWSAARFMIDPQGGDVSAAVAAEAIQVAREMVERDQG